MATAKQAAQKVNSTVGELGQNAQYSINGNELVIRIDLSKEFGRSASGKTTIIATSRGNQTLPGDTPVTIGLNVYRK